MCNSFLCWSQARTLDGQPITLSCISCLYQYYDRFSPNRQPTHRKIHLKCSSRAHSVLYTAQELPVSMGFPASDVTYFWWWRCGLWPSRVLQGRMCVCAPLCHCFILCPSFSFFFFIFYSTFFGLCFLTCCLVCIRESNRRMTDWVRIR